MEQAERATSAVLAHLRKFAESSRRTTLSCLKLLMSAVVAWRIGLVINDLPTVESKAPSQFGGVLLASARHAPLAPDKGYNTHDTLSLVYTAA